MRVLKTQSTAGVSFSASGSLAAERGQWSSGGGDVAAVWVCCLDGAHTASCSVERELPRWKFIDCIFKYTPIKIYLILFEDEVVR